MQNANCFGRSHRVEALVLHQASVPSWTTGRFAVSDMWAAYVGPATDNAIHAHAAIQVTLPVRGRATIDTRQGRVTSESPLVVRPLIDHALSAVGPVVIIYL